MENYIKKINDKLEKSGDKKYAKRVKFSFQLSGGLLLAIGLAGFLASFITFMVLFFKTKTDDAFIAWMVAAPFLVLIIIGSVLARIGDTLLPQDKTKINGIYDSFNINKKIKNIKETKAETKDKKISDTTEEQKTKED